MLSGHVTERPASDGSIVFLTHRFERNGEEVVDIRSSVERLGQGASTTETILDDSSQIDTIVPAGEGYYLARATQRNAWVPRVGYAPADIEVVRLDGAGHVSRVDLPRLECCTDMHWNDEQAILLLHGNERTGSGASTSKRAGGPSRARRQPPIPFWPPVGSAQRLRSREPLRPRRQRDHRPRTTSRRRAIPVQGVRTSPGHRANDVRHAASGHGTVRMHTGGRPHRRHPSGGTPTAARSETSGSVIKMGLTSIESIRPRRCDEAVVTSS
jgi:hypothetical protein